MSQVSPAASQAAPVQDGPLALRQVLFQMKVYLLWCGEWEASLEGVFSSEQKARDHVNEERKLLGADPVTWKNGTCKVKGIPYSTEEREVR